jgi:hypothetical protein
MLTPVSRRSREVTSYLRLQHFPLSNAYLCQDCNAIGNCANQCPACASEVLMSLAVILDRADDVPVGMFSSLPTLTAASSPQGPALAA